VAVTGITPEDINAALDLMDRQQPVRVFCVPWVPEGFPERPDFIVVPRPLHKRPPSRADPCFAKACGERLRVRLAQAIPET
jgi:hypothetical protein